MVTPRIFVEGLDDFNRAVRHAADQGLGKRMGQANKLVGQFVTRELTPAPRAATVGQGRGADVRASASKRDVILRAGGAHRAHSDPQITRMRQWGKKPVNPFNQPRNARPYILRSALDRQDQVEQFWLEAVSQAMDPAFHKTEP